MPWQFPDRETWNTVINVFVAVGTGALAVAGFLQIHEVRRERRIRHARKMAGSIYYPMLSFTVPHAPTEQQDLTNTWNRIKMEQPAYRIHLVPEVLRLSLDRLVELSAKANRDRPDFQELADSSFADEMQKAGFITPGDGKPSIFFGTGAAGVGITLYWALQNLGGIDAWLETQHDAKMAGSVSIHTEKSGVKHVPEKALLAAVRRAEERVRASAEFAAYGEACVAATNEAVRARQLIESTLDKMRPLLEELTEDNPS